MSIIERVARALCAELDPMSDPDDARLLGYPIWRRHIRAARIAIEAMRGAAPTMIASALPITHGASDAQKRAAEAAIALLPPVSAERRFQGRTAAEDLSRDWDTMIDAALAEGPKPP